MSAENVSTPITPGVSVTRRQIFEAVTATPGWPVALVQHIEVAKALGATTFEISTRAGKAPAPKRESYISRMFGYDDSWKDGEEIETVVVTVHAVVVE